MKKLLVMLSLFLLTNVSYAYLTPPPTPEMVEYFLNLGRMDFIQLITSIIWLIAFFISIVKIIKYNKIIIRDSIAKNEILKLKLFISFASPLIILLIALQYLYVFWQNVPYKGNFSNSVFSRVVSIEGQIFIQIITIFIISLLFKFYKNKETKRYTIIFYITIFVLLCLALISTLISCDFGFLVYKL